MCLVTFYHSGWSLFNHVHLNLTWLFVPHPQVAKRTTRTTWWLCRRTRRGRANSGRSSWCSLLWKVETPHILYYFSFTKLFAPQTTGSTSLSNSHSREPLCFTLIKNGLKKLQQTVQCSVEFCVLFSWNCFRFHTDILFRNTVSAFQPRWMSFGGPTELNSETRTIDWHPVDFGCSYLTLTRVGWPLLSAIWVFKVKYDSRFMQIPPTATAPVVETCIFFTYSEQQGASLCFSAYRGHRKSKRRPIVCKEMCVFCCFCKVFLYALSTDVRFVGNVALVCVPCIPSSRPVQLILVWYKVFNPHQHLLIFDTKDVMSDVCKEGVVLRNLIKT